MTAPALPALPIDETAPGEFERLRRFVHYHLGRFALGLVRVNDPQQRNNVLDALADALRAEGVQLARLDLSNRHPASLRAAIQAEPEAAQAVAAAARGEPAALAIVGMEHLIEAEPRADGRPAFAAALNLEREQLRAALPLPVLLCLTDHAMDRLDLAAPDFFDWYSAVFNLRPAHPAAAGAETLAPSPSEASPPADDLTPEARAARLDLLEERRAELMRQGAEARPRLAQVLSEMGEMYARWPEFHQRQLAVTPLREARDIYRELGDRAGEARALEQLANVNYWIDEYHWARHGYERAARLYRELGTRLGEANCIRALGDVHVQLAEYAAARTKYEQALPLYRELGTRLGEAHCIRALGDVHRVLAEYASARDRYEQALALYRELGTRLDEANVYWELGRMEFRLGTIVEGYETVRRAAQLYTAIGIPFAATAQAWLAEHRARYLAEKAEQEQRTQAQAIQPYRELIEWVVEGSRNNPDARQLAQAKIEALRREGHTAELAESLDRILNKGMRVEKRLVQFLENSEHVAVVREILRRLGM